mgnify:CR=1 FL=1
MLIQIPGTKLVRDTDSMALINKDISGLEDYKMNEDMIERFKEYREDYLHTFDIGHDTYRWRSIYLSKSIFFTNNDHISYDDAVKTITTLSGYQQNNSIPQEIIGYDPNWK